MSGALELNVDWSQFKIDDTTKLPIKSISDLKYKVDKFYDGDAFVVKQEWCDNTPVSYTHLDVYKRQG